MKVGDLVQWRGEPGVVLKIRDDEGLLCALVGPTEGSPAFVLSQALGVPGEWVPVKVLERRKQ